MYPIWTNLALKIMVKATIFQGKLMSDNYMKCLSFKCKFEIENQ